MTVRGAYVSATVDIGDAEEGLAAMERRARQLGPAFSELKKPMREDQRDHARTKMGPETGWSPRAASTVHAHKKLPRKLLGRLPTAVGYKATAQGVTAESKVRWSLSQQEGERVGHGARLPARPFLWISDHLLDVAADVISRVLERAFGGG